MIFNAICLAVAVLICRYQFEAGNWIYMGAAGLTSAYFFVAIIDDCMDRIREFI